MMRIRPVLSDVVGKRALVEQVDVSDGTALLALGRRHRWRLRGAGGGPWHEDMPLPVDSPHGIPAIKKVAETLSSFAAETTGISMVRVRPSGVCGPGGRNSARIFALPGLVHAAVRPGSAHPASSPSSAKTTRATSATSKTAPARSR
jgi:nucleoside-diphosphate-sugar epimerase